MIFIHFSCAINTIFNERYISFFLIFRGDLSMRVAECRGMKYCWSLNLVGSLTMGVHHKNQLPNGDDKSERERDHWKRKSFQTVSFETFCLRSFGHVRLVCNCTCLVSEGREQSWANPPWNYDKSPIFQNGNVREHFNETAFPHFHEFTNNLSRTTRGWMENVARLGKNEKEDQE